MVENIVSASTAELDTSIASEINSAGTTPEQVLKFTEVCLKVGEICQTAIEHAHQAFSGL